MKYKASLDKNPVLSGFGYWPKVAWHKELRRWLGNLTIRLLVIIILLGVCHLVQTSRLNVIKQVARTVEFVLLEQPVKAVVDKSLSK